MPYELIALFVSLGLAARYLLLDGASPGSKFAVAMAVCASLVIWWRYPGLLVAATLLQVAASIYVLVYSRVNQHASWRGAAAAKWLWPR
ncbi:MAG TPA: hypothetical protein VGH75_00890 [Steroidobacteraceae bacterium]|jgi:hypothetical protein